MKVSKELRIYIILVAIVLIWGLSWPVCKVALLYISPFWFASIRLIVGTAAMFFIALVTKNLILPSTKDLPLIVSLGIFQIGFFILLLNLGLMSHSSGSAAILVYTTPLWVMPISVYVFKERATKLKKMGFFLGIIGILFMLNPWKMDWGNQQTLLGLLYLLGASFSMAISILCARNMAWQHSPLELVPWQLLVGSILLSIVSFIADPRPLIIWNSISIFSLLFTAIAATAFGFWGMSVVSKDLPATVTSMGFLGVPVSGVLFSALLLHESIDIFMVFAMLFITSGLTCVMYDEKKAE